jgi:hypothetical protein
MSGARHAFRMALYFSAAVWSSLALCTFALVEDRLPRYRRTTAAIPRPAGRRVPVRVASGFSGMWPR